MRNFLKQWLKAQASYFFWGYVPLVLIITFGVFAVTYFRPYALQAIGVLIIITFAFVVWFNRPR
jgi:uncharacterized membrane protein